MSDRLTEDKEDIDVSGPVITISRLYGCPAKVISKKLSEELNNKANAKGFKDIKWKYVTKEIMFESARALEMDPSKIKYVFDYEKKSLIDELLTAHSNKYYKSDRKIRNTIARVIRNMAKEGHVVIVGRGGVAITRDIPRSLHINLQAPLEWRMVRIAERYDKSLDEAEKIIKDIDKKRELFRDYFQGKNTDYTQFDLTFNCMTLSTDEITAIIMKAIDERKLLK
jgi:cytidylate kinase